MKKFITTTVALISLAVPAGASTLGDAYTSYVAMGDSLTDSGKVPFLYAPSAQNPETAGFRFSNGPTYAEYIADEIKAGGNPTLNLALGGATANDVNDNSDFILSTFSGQITALMGGILSGSFAPGTNPLVSVYFGANDFFQNADMKQAANDVTDGIRDLVAAGRTANVSFENFLVLGLPNLADTPLFKGSEDAQTATTDFNEQLFANLNDLGSAGLNILGFDVDSVFQDIRKSVIDETYEFGIFDINNPCRLSFGLEGPSCVDAGIDPNALLFNDAVHPNGVAHQLIGARSIAALEANLSAVPLPAGLPLYLAGLLAFGIVRRRVTA